LPGDPALSGSVFQEPPQKSEFTQAHISLFHLSIFWLSKLSAVYKNTGTHGELFSSYACKDISFVKQCAFWRK
jgi:hypothetical protein